MGLFEIIAILIVLAAVFSFINHRLLKLPTTIGLMILSLAFSLLLVVVGHFSPTVTATANDLLASIDFNETVMHGMLGFLLFAGALHINLSDLAQRKGLIAILATIGIITSTAIVGLLTFALTRAVGLDLRLIHCLIFGALISPTDPIAVLAILKTLGAPKSVETKIAGESLFNDGVGVVVFLALLGIAGLGGHSVAHQPAARTAAPAAQVEQHSDETSATIAADAHQLHTDDDNDDATVTGVAMLFVQETLGGALLGLVCGLVAYWMLKQVDNYQVEVLISLALVFGGYAVAYVWHLSGPIAMVVAGLLIGNHGRTLAMSATTREHLDTFWELIDEILNAVLFVLIGLEVLILTGRGSHILAGVLAIPIVLLARFIAVGGPVTVMRHAGRDFTPHAIKVLTWGGLRGGISVALALSLKQKLTAHGAAPAGTGDVILVMTYVVVTFSIIAQGLTISPLLRKLGLTGAAADEHAH